MDTVSAADYHDIVQVSDPRLAPDGESVVFVRRAADGEEDYAATLYRAPADGDGDPTAFTQSAGEDSQPRFSPDGERLAFVSTRSEDDDPDPQVWVMPTDGGEARRVTDVPGSPADLAWAPDGERLCFSQRVTAAERGDGIDVDRSTAAGEEAYERPDQDPKVIDRTVYRSRVGRWVDDTRRHVYTVDPTAETVSCVTDDDADHVAPTWGDGETLYYAVRRADDPYDTVEYDVDAADFDSGTTERVFQTTGFPEQLDATPDGRIAHPYSPEEKAGLRQQEVHVYDRERGAVHEPTASIDRTVGAFQWGPDDEHLYVQTPDRGASALRRLEWQGDEAEVVHREGEIEGFHAATDGIVLVQSEWDYPGDAFRVDPDGGEPRRLTEVNGDYLAARAVAEPEEITVDSEGDEIQGWLLTPPEADSDEQFPLAVEIHGGPHVMWTPAGSMWHEFQTLAARGYAVFWCNPRGSAGYGEDFMAANERDWGAVTMADIEAGIERVTEREDVDADAQFVTGGSFGGYMTSWLVGHTDRFDGAVTQRGVYHLASFYGTTDEAFKLVEWDFGTTPPADADFLWEHSPVAHADGIETPTLVVHAEEDYRVPISEAETLYRLLRKHGTDTRFVRYPREGHDLSRGGEPAHVVDRIERIARWFDGYSPHHDVDPALEREADADLSGED